MSTRKSTAFYGVLFGFVCLVAGMVIASRLDLAPRSFASVNVPPTNSAPLTGSLDASTFRTIAHDATPAVVTIVVTTSRPAANSVEDFFGFELPAPFNNPRRSLPGQPGRPGGQNQPQEPPAEEPAQGAGSGFIIDKAGFILTNNHVIENAKEIEVHLSSMNEDEPGLAAKVVGRDELTDSALIQLTELPKEPLVEAKFGDSDQMAPGDWVMAIGNPFTLSNTVTVGVVSAVGRPINGSVKNRQQEMIQTDAAINRGNSGGPLLNIRGEVIGINTMIYADGTSGGNIGVGFAVPINTVRDLIPQLRQGKVTRSRIGVSLADSLTTEYAKSLGLSSAGGVEIESVASGGPAAVAGMKAGDVIVEFNGQAVKNNAGLVRLVTGTPPGTTVPVKLFRDKKAITLNVKVEELDLVAEQGGSLQATPEENRRERAPAPAPRETGFGAQIQNLDELTPRLRQALRLPAGRTGAIVTSVTPFSPADDAKLTQGDVILSVNADVVRNADEASKALNAIPAGSTARLVVWKAGAEVLLRLRKR